MYNPYSYSSSMFSRSVLSLGGWQFIVGVIIGLICTILLYVLVFPKKNEGSLPSFFRMVRDFFDVKYLLIEKIAKFIYVFLSLASLCIGFFLLFGETFLAGFILMIFGPILHRLVYEMFMLLILLVKNVMEINRKLKGTAGASASADPFQFDAPAAEPEVPQVRRCPNCGAELEDGDLFCRSCGTKV